MFLENTVHFEEQWSAMPAFAHLCGCIICTGDSFQEAIIVEAIGILIWVQRLPSVSVKLGFELYVLYNRWQCENLGFVILLSLINMDNGSYKDHKNLAEEGLGQRDVQNICFSVLALVTRPSSAILCHHKHWAQLEHLSIIWRNSWNYFRFEGEWPVLPIHHTSPKVFL